MGFSNFKTEIEAAKKFNLITDIKPFVQALPLQNIPDHKLIDHENNLSDIPDFLIAPTTQIRGEMGIPPLCVVEAKKDDWEQGATKCYAIVTTGEEWQLGRFHKENMSFIKQLKKFSVLDDNDEPNNLQTLFDTLNWLFNEATKVEVYPK